jgi:hypothetical protein
MRATNAKHLEARFDPYAAERLSSYPTLAARRALATILLPSVFKVTSFP